MKKKLLFVIPSLGAGGAEKSLVNLLNTIDANRCEIDLLLFSQKGLFFSQVPKFVKKLELNKELQVFQMPLRKSLYTFLKQGKLGLMSARFQYFLENQLNPNKAVAEQNAWLWISKAMQPLTKQYDVAISYLEKTSAYFVAEKVNAEKKIAWIHTDYEKSGLNPEFDRDFFGKFNHIVTISEQCKKSVQNNFTECSVKIIENITAGEMITQLSMEELPPSPKPVKLLTIGRLSKEKGIDIAVEAARILKAKQVDFEWLIIGDGFERSILERMIARYELSENFKLVGVRKNPYPYLRNCTVYIQPSRYEGKSIAIDEALILHKPVVVTAFSSAKDQIIHHFNGLVAEMNPDSLSQQIIEMLQDEVLRRTIVENVKSQRPNNEIFKYYEVFGI